MQELPHGLFQFLFHVAGTGAFGLWIYSWIKRSKKKPEDFS